MGYGCTRTIRRRLSNRRGAAFLLAVYFASLMFLLLGGVSLQRSVLEQRAANTSRDLNQSFWMADGGFEQALTALRAGTLPTFNRENNTCAYGTAVTSTTTFPMRSDYMICQATNPDGTVNPTQYRVEVVGASLSGAPVWVSAFVERQVPKLTLSQAIVGLDGVTVSLGRVGGVNTANPTTPITLDVRPLSPLMFASYVTPAFSTASVFNNHGNMATKATRRGAMNIANMSAIFGDILAASSGTTQISDNSQNIETGSGGVAADLANFPPVQVPTVNAADLGSVLTAGAGPDFPAMSGITLPDGSITLTNAWAALLPGTYRVKNLTLDRTVFSTTGPVDLFVTGSLTLQHSYLYGQPSGTAANQFNFSPPNLRVFVAPADSQDKIRIRGGSLLAGVLYAPSMDVRVDHRSALLGALVSKTAQVGILPSDDPEASPSDFALVSATPGAYDGQVFYDQAVGSIPISPSPEKPAANTLFYTVHKSLNETAAMTQTDRDKLTRWFQFLAPSAPAVPPSNPSPGYSGGGGGGGGGGGCG